MKVEQALIAVGGNATRLKAGGIETPVSKSFLTIAEQPLLFWSLSALATAGIQKVVLAGNRVDHLQYAENVINDLPVTFQDVIFYQDEGLGVHGLPWQTKQLLDKQFIFECGHGISRPEHYQNMDSVKQAGKVVFSAFATNRLNPRQPVILAQGHASLASKGTLTGYALAHPLLLDQEYAEKLPELDFNVSKIIRHYSETDRLQYVHSDMPPEFDIASEYSEANKIYERMFSER